MCCTLLQVHCGGWLNKPVLVADWKVDLESLWRRWQRWWTKSFRFSEGSIVRCVPFYCIENIVLLPVAFLFLL